jgi:hypothetical protein
MRPLRSQLEGKGWRQRQSAEAVLDRKPVAAQFRDIFAA